MVALVLVTGTSTLSTDTYIASLPDVQTTLGTTSSMAQLTMTAFIVGMAAGQLLSGPVSDSRGRRRLIIAASVVFTVLSVLCALVTNDWLFVAERAVQGIAAGTAVAVGRAVVNDAWKGRAASAMFGTLSSVSLIGPVIAPAIGGVLVTFGSWRIVFWFLAAVGAAMVIAAYLKLPETLPPERRHPGGLAQLRLRAADLLRDRHFASPVLVQCMTTAGFFIYIGGSSFVLQDGLGVSTAMYTIIFATNATAMVTASVTFRLLVMRTGPVVLRRCAIAVQTTGVLALFAASLVATDHRPPLAVVWVCLAVMTAGLGMYLPSNGAIAQFAGRRAAGTASAFGGGLPFLAGALTTPLTGLLGSQTVLTMASCMAFFFTCAAVASIVLRKNTLDPDNSPVTEPREVGTATLP
ncbi:DHA1 family bicyclomycin/chloramphenicol resistance-like MFS transporter [Actinoplanes lutulentus]|uniref:DHA1 family bicyclomycin/chloramphenicol resistance-like MFS transporter n=1 Tax=Actinoplanes lutulentus TaxID=1287878 RepID=A0A327ZAY5_9ACTN|nr:multidrug effflux MFS transporter [Actinoplanes lutulentus]MBB2947375.1 DHA1 family bicyclomycin/chloramphenicol resistance-like MFS transporter [Actinoplanes lutulentus]RAK36649.1 DHA1 family bicyclomycin/chloramphenicol resistance-like MFS transporter [Actinoplanes lutulentus]